MSTLQFWKMDIRGQMKIIVSAKITTCLELTIFQLDDQGFNDSNSFIDDIFSVCL